MDRTLRRRLAAALPLVIAGLAVGAVMGQMSLRGRPGDEAPDWGRGAAAAESHSGASRDAPGRRQVQTPAFSGPLGPPPEGSPLSADEAARRVRSGLQRRATVASVDVRSTTAGSYIQHRGAFLNWEAIGVSPDSPAWVVTAIADGELYPRDAGLMDSSDAPSDKGVFVVYLADYGIRFAVGMFRPGDKYDRWRLTLPSP